MNLPHIFLLFILALLVPLQAKAKAPEFSHALVKPDYHSGYRERNQNRKSTVYQQVLALVKTQLNLELENKHLAIYALAALNETHYAFQIRSEVAVAMEGSKITRCDMKKKHDAAASYVCKDFEVFGVVDINTNDVRLLDNSQGDIQTILSSGDTRQGFIYGCHQEYPLQVADVNFDGVKELLFIGGKGPFHMDGEFDVKTYLKIYTLTSLHTPIFSTQLNSINSNPSKDWSSPFYSPAANPANTKFESKSTKKNQQSGKAAERSYTKVYFDNVDDDEQPDLVVWTRYYQSKEKGSDPAGYQFMEEELAWYEFRESRYMPQKTTAKDIKTWLDKKQLSWRKGYPSENLCLYYKKTDPLILTQDFDQETINDPVLAR